MIATKSFRFIHLHKCAGQFVNRLIRGYYPDARFIGYHLPRAESPSQLQHLPAFGFIRNPWDWYVSWYSFNVSNPKRNPIFRVISNSGELGFAQSINNLISLGKPEYAEMRNNIALQLPLMRGNQTGSGITGPAISTFNTPECGYLTWLWRYMFFVDGRADDMHIARTEQLREVLPSILANFGTVPNNEIVIAIQRADPVNTSTHEHYRKYYDDSLAEAVFNADREIIAAYGYGF